MNNRSKRKRGRQNKHKTEAKNTEPEVFVLPPNLLEKLGIKLDKIQSIENTSTISENTTGVPEDLAKNAHDYVSTSQPFKSDSESSILETASLMTESVFLSPTFVPTANIITGEVQIAGIIEECKVNDGNLTQGSVSIDSFPVPLSSANELLNTFESVVTAQSNIISDIQVPDMCFNEMCNSRKFNKSPDFHGCAVNSYMENEINFQESLINETAHNVTLDPNENQKRKNTKINIINDEIIDFAKINKVFNFDNDNVLTPVSIGMILPPTKSYIDSFALNGSKDPESGMNRSHGKVANNMDVKRGESGCGTYDTRAEVGKVFSRSNLVINETKTDSTKINGVEAHVSIPNFVDAVVENFENITTKRENDSCSKIISLGSNSIDQSYPVVTKQTDQQNVSVFAVQCPNKSIDFNKFHKIVEKTENFVFGKKDANEFSDFCNKMTKDVSGGDQNKQEGDLESFCSLATYALPRDTNETNDDSNNCMRRSKLCIQGVEKPGGETSPKKSIQKVYYNRQKVNKQKALMKYNQQNEVKVTLTRQSGMGSPKTNNQGIKEEVDLNSKKSENQENLINNIVIDSVWKGAEYCQCSDFGQLKYYDEDSFYEHIHFWHHRNVTCELDSIFSIYVDDLVCDRYEEDATVEIFDETPEESSFKICWYETYDDHVVSKKLVPIISEIEENNSKNVDRGESSCSIDIEMSVTGNNFEKCDKSTKSEKVSTILSKSVKVQKTTFKTEYANKDEDENKTEYSNVAENSKEADLNGEIEKKYSNDVGNVNQSGDLNNVENVNTRTRMKRKRSLRVSSETNDNSSVDYDEPLSKRSVRWGVCRKSLAAREWEEHSSKEHGFIAWKTGEDFDPKDTQIIRKVKQKLKADGILKCTFCNFKIDHCKEFLEHVEECLRNKGNTVEADCKEIDIDTDTARTSVRNNSLNSPTKAEMNTRYENEKDSIVRSTVASPGIPKDESSDSIKNIDTESSLVKKRPVKSGDSSMKDVKESAIKHSRSIEKNDTIFSEEKSLKHGNTFKKINTYPGKNKVLTTKERHVQRNSHKIIDRSIENLLHSTKDKSLEYLETPSKGNTTPKYTSTPLIKENIEKCMDYAMNIDSESTSKSTAGETVIIRCGVCKLEMNVNLWNDHMQKVHDYLAWKEGENSLDLEDQDEIWHHLYLISKERDGLICSKCGLTRKYVKSYLTHIKQCEEMDKSINASSSLSVDINDRINKIASSKVTKCVDTSLELNVTPESSSVSSVEQKINKSVHSPTKKKHDKEITTASEKVNVKCGVCKQEMDDSVWTDHMQKTHDYLAWKEGESSLNLQDKEQIWHHLQMISKKCDGLVCAKCGLNRKYVKSYLTHIKQCDGMDQSIDAGSSLNGDIYDDNTKIPSAQPTKRIDPSLELIVIPESSSGPSVDQSINKSVHSPTKKKHDKEITTASEKVNVKCGVCQQEMDDNVWTDHMLKAHGYLAWKEGETSLNLQDKAELWQHLYLISKKYDGLVCAKCGLNRKYVKSYLAHIKQCDGMPSNNDSILSSLLDAGEILDVSMSQKRKNELPVKIICGVCSESCVSENWIIHIQTKHDYLAWKEGEPKLDLQDQEAIQNHLRGVIKTQGYILCKNCGVDRKYGAKALKKYLRHIETCGKDTEEICDDDTVEESEESKNNLNSSIPSQNVIVKCGVCEQDIEDTLWIEHIENKHKYLAWKLGEPPLDLENVECVKMHLSKISKRLDGLRCANCGLRKKYPKAFLGHIEECNDLLVSSGTINKEFAECAVCSEKMKPEQWRSHAMKKHYNVAWKLGDFPIDIKSPYAVEKYLKEYKQEEKVLVCKVCGLSRVSLIGFYAHVLVCGKSEKELEEYNEICEICNKPYVCVYKNQHMTAHREQVYALERKMLRLEKKKEEETNETLDTTGEKNCSVSRRKAAVKARDVIEKLKTDEDDPKTCAKCGFEAATAMKMSKHKCVIDTYESGSDTEESDELEALDRVPDVSEDEKKDYAKKKRRRKRKKESILSAKIPLLPFKYNKVESYTDQSERDFFKIHYTDDILFPEWLECNCEHLENSQSVDYLPKIEKSCKIKISNNWDTYNRFEVKKLDKGCTMFIGGAVKCLSWIPSRLDEGEKSKNYLAVSCHMDKDTPRINFDELSSGPGVIQIWEFGCFINVHPKLVMCIAHDYGTVWSMDWCPSGARNTDAGGENRPRLGLVALACSDGFVHILSVPYPKAESEKIFVRLKPVAELRISSTSERKVYQATAVSWSKQKGHAIIMVGYADGITALFDLYSTSPLLKYVENGITVYYPYMDRRDHNVCITGVDICPIGGRSTSGLTTAVCSSSVLGSAMMMRPREGQPRVDARAPATACRFAPGWPAVLVAADDHIASHAPNELDWYGCGRKWGPTCSLGECQRCGRVLAYTRPLLRHFHALPPYANYDRQTIATIKTIPFGKKRKIKNDGLSMLVEPLTYDEVVTRYGVEVVLYDGQDEPEGSSYRDPYSERFPLADTTAIAFCASRRYHRHVAVGLHSGFVLLLVV